MIDLSASAYVLESLRCVLAVAGPSLAWAWWPLLDRPSRIIACATAAVGLCALFLPPEVLLTPASVFVAGLVHCSIRIRQTPAASEKEFFVFDLFSPMTTNTSRRIDQREFIDRFSTMVLYIPPGVVPAGLTPEVRNFLEQYRIAPGLYAVMLDNHAMHILSSAGLYAYILGSNHAQAVEDFATLLKISEGEAHAPSSQSLHPLADTTPSPSPSPSAPRSPLFTGSVPVTITEEGHARLSSFAPPTHPTPPPPSPDP